MYESLLNAIEHYDKIVIHRHRQPDLDALGSQLGLRGLIHGNFSGKQVRLVGDENDYAYIGSMDTVDDAFYEGALAIILDVSQHARISDDRYRLAEERVVVDHHLNTSDLDAKVLSFPEHIAVCQILTDMAMRHDLCVDAETATYLFAGLVTDSGRFRYPQVNALTFRSAAFLVERGARHQWLYKKLYTESLAVKKLKGHVVNHFQTTSHGVAFMKNDRTVMDTYEVSFFTVSRGMVNQMAGIKGIPVWVNLTEDHEGVIHCEIRSEAIPVVEVAKRYGGGGHGLACGCTFASWQETDQLLADLDRLVAEESEAL